MPCNLCECLIPNPVVLHVHSNCGWMVLREYRFGIFYFDLLKEKYPIFRKYKDMTKLSNFALAFPLHLRKKPNDPLKPKYLDIFLKNKSTLNMEDQCVTRVK